MNRYAQLALLAATLVAVTAGAPRPLNSDDAPAHPAVASTTSAFHVDLGDFLTLQRRFGAAREAYSTAVRLERADGRLPVEPLRRIANAYYFEGDYESAATTLEELAVEAAALEDYEAQIWAVADAAWMAGLAGDEGAVEGYRERLHRMGQEHRASDLVNEIDAKLMQDFTVYSPHLPSW